MFKNRWFDLLVLVLAALFLRLFFFNLLTVEKSIVVRLAGAIIILLLGSVFVLTGCARIIEETTDVLSRRTKLAAGLLQSLGTAFPDMALGIVAAWISLGLRETNYALAVSYAVMAAATTFGSNIYNIAHAGWCVWRQNLANQKRKSVWMFPGLRAGGILRPLAEHENKPSILELDTAIDVLHALAILTAVVAVGMVLFGRITKPLLGVESDLYQLIRSVGFLIFLLCLFIMYLFRKTKRAVVDETEKAEERKIYGNQANLTIWIHLFLSGIVILLTAEAMVHGVQTVCEITGLPIVVAGVLAGLIGCLGEMIVVHDFSVHPKGRLADALVGVGMDNIVTTMAASIVAIMGGIFLGGNALILIFVMILTLNTFLIVQISRLKNDL